MNFQTVRTKERFQPTAAASDYSRALRHARINRLSVGFVRVNIRPLLPQRIAVLRFNTVGFQSRFGLIYKFQVLCQFPVLRGEVSALFSLAEFHILTRGNLFFDRFLFPRLFINLNDSLRDPLFGDSGGNITNSIVGSAELEMSVVIWVFALTVIIDRQYKYSPHILLV